MKKKIGRLTIEKMSGEEDETRREVLNFVKRAYKKRMKILKQTNLEWLT